MQRFNIFKKIKFEKSGLPIIPVCFYVLIVLSVFTFFSIIKTKSYHFNIKGFNYPLENIKITFEANDRLHENAYIICYNDYCKTSATNEFRSYYFSELTNEEPEFFEKKTTKIYLAADESIGYFPKNLKNIDINVGNKNIYLNSEDILKLEKKEISINLNNNGKKELQKYNALVLPEVNNYKGFFSHIENIFLSLFYNWNYFIFPYSWLFLAMLIYIFNKDEFKFNIKLNKKIYFTIFGGIILLGALLRFVDIKYYPLWIDEIYTKHIATDNFFNCFKDAGNPPLFFILEYLFTLLFSKSLLSLRFLPFVFGMLFIVYTFLLFRDIFKEEKNKLPIFAIFAGFMAAINTVNIYHSQEARGYSLCMLLTLASIYYLFRYLKNPNKKDLILTGVINILLVNANYYLILFTATNFIWGIIDLLQNKSLENKKKEIIKFTSTFIIAAISFLPYFIISSKVALSEEFNGWIPALSEYSFSYAINEFFINKYIFIILCTVLLINLIICYIPKKALEKMNIKINSNRENLFLYLIYTLTLIIILACFISLFIKPIFHKRVLLSIYALLFLTEMIAIGGFIEFIKENKFIKALKITGSIILILFCFKITSPMPTREHHDLSKFMKFVAEDVEQFDDSYEIHFINAHTKEYLKEYPEIYNNKRIKFHFFNSNTGHVLRTIKKEKDDIQLEFLIANDNNKGAFSLNNVIKEKYKISEGKKIVIYFNSIGVDTKYISNLNPAIRIYRNNSVTSAKLIYKN